MKYLSKTLVLSQFRFSEQGSNRGVILEGQPQKGQELEVVGGKGIE
ncbi:hypothetical protein SAMN04487898_106309 [Pedobacter sp. ok626]|nr:hypothetical protein [Pedobacter sp. ok626]SDK20413.1 hypothetical protein SAMN04487898_106309 [Pedobacter sp. ok626]